MFCNYCGKEISNESLFCTNCGNKISPRAPTPKEPQTPVSQAITSPSITSDSTAIKKKNKILIPLIIVGALLVITIGVLAIFFIRKSLNNRNDKEAGINEGRRVAIEDSIKINDNNEEELEDNTTDLEIDISDDLIEYSADTVITDDTEITFEERYNYTELPDVLSLDSDLRFSYVDYFSLSDSSVYSFQFNEINATEADFYNACEEYSLLLQELNGFTYEPDISDQKYAESGLVVYYLTKDNYGISITASLEDLHYFAYINIYSLAGEIDSSEVIGEIDMLNYDSFLANRDSISFTSAETVNMENGLSLYIYEVMGNYTEDENVVIDVVLDISSYYSDYYLNNGDFFILPLDATGNILSDAIPIGWVIDGAGNEVTMPFLLSSSSYDSYTFYFPVPNDTMTLLLYATNILKDDYSFPVHVMQVGN
jgi:hypothetical protein